MRPLRLELKGFSTFRDETVIDFMNADLVAFVGPTGAGKSTIIDGIIFALYGSVVRYKSANLVAPVINQLSNEARVRLDFAVRDRTYTAVRVVRRTSKGATTKEARLESANDVLADNARELDAAVEELLGLTFDQFTKTVVLPQGEFARFLTETPQTRQSLLRSLLGMELYRRVGSTARERARTADTKHRALLEQRADREMVTGEVVAEAAAEFSKLAALKDPLAEHIEAQLRATLGAKEAGRREAEAAKQLTLLKSLKMPAAAGKLDKALATFDEKRDAARDEAEAAAAELAEATERLGKLRAPSHLERILEFHAEAATIDSDSTQARLSADKASSTLDRAATSEAAAQADLDELEQKRNDIRVKAGAAGLRDILVVGEPCPVCEQNVDEFPKHDVSDELIALEQHVDSQRVATLKARTQRREAEQQYAHAKAKITALDNRRAEIAEALDGESNLLATTADLHSVRAAETSAAKTESKAQRALTKLQDAEAQYEALNANSVALRRDLTAARDAVGSLHPPPPLEESITADWGALVQWSKSVAAEVEAAKEQANVEAEANEGFAVEHQKLIAELCRPHTNGELPDDPAAWLAAEIGRSQTQVGLLERELAAQDKTNTRIAELGAESAVAGELGRLLNASGFEQWLMADVMHTLAERASEAMFELSSGAYSMVTDGTDFSIRDHRNADEIRGARTLSGGETFLASLSLALALTDNIAFLASAGAPEIESMFLDEGFGTLDTETLDTVASAIEELGARGRMIGVVTHIGDLADRIPVRFDVARTPNGSTVTRTTLD